MKKMLLTLILLFALILPAFAVDFLPRYKNNIKNFGIGLYFGEGIATIYKAPDDKSQVIAKLTWNTEKVMINNKVYQPKDVFAVFLPKNALAGFIALDEQENEYTEIIYDNITGAKGWIKNVPDTKVFYWRQLFYKYGKTKGLYMFYDVPKDHRTLMLSPDENSTISHQFMAPQFIRLQLIKGNWALIKVVDYDNEQKVGWFKWRNPDGTLNLFPQFNG